MVDLKNVIHEKSLDFAVRILRLSKKLKYLDEYEIASQIVRSGTSIGANVAEAKYAQSRKDFISKMAIARKEASETLYWLGLLVRADILPKNAEDALQSLSDEAAEILKILTSIIKTASDKSD